MEKSISSKGRTTIERKMKSMYEYHNKETKKEWVQEREIDKEDIMPPTKMGIKQLAKQSMLDQQFWRNQPSFTF